MQENLPLLDTICNYAVPPMLVVAIVAIGIAFIKTHRRLSSPTVSAKRRFYLR